MDGCKMGKQAIITGPGTALVHGEDHSILEGTFEPVREGEPLRPGESIWQRQEDGSYREAFTMPGAKGPVQVATEGYRRGWDETFGALN